MRSRHHILVVFSAFVSLMLIPSLSWAINDTCANREPMPVGTTTSQSIAASSSAFFATRLVAGRSYLFLAWTPFQDASETSGDVNPILWGDAGCTTNTGADSSLELEEPWIDNISSSASADLDAIGFVPTTSGEYVLEVQNGAAAGITHRIVIFETSTYSPWWFVGGSNQAFITLSNRSNVTNSVIVTMNGPTGSQCGQTTVSVPANGNTFVRVNDFPGCVTAVSGSAQISFLGTPGTIQANTTVIDGVQGTSFDEPFVPRMAWPLQER